MYHQPCLLQEIDQYLSCLGDGMGMLKPFLAAHAASVQLNTALLACAACEHLFSCAGLIFTLQTVKAGYPWFCELNQKICI